MKKYITILFSFLSIFAKAQDNYTLKYMPQLQQSQWYDATNLPDTKVSIGFPAISGFSFYVYNSGFTFHDVFQTINDSTKGVNMGKIFNQLKPVNYISFGAQVPIFSINIAKQNVSAGFSISDKMDMQFSYPADMFKLLWYGNGHYLGQNLEVGNFGLNASWYREFAFHIAVKHNKWTFGINPKILVGKTNINTKQSSIIMNTDTSFYKVKATANMNFQTSGIADSADNANGGYFGSTSSAVDYLFNVNNIGHAIDLGVKYEISEHLNVSAGINNLGYIHWASYLHDYSVYNQTFNFDGLHAENFLQGDSTALASQTLNDSLKNLIKFNKTSDAYTTNLPYDIYLMANYQFKHNWFGLMFSARHFNSQFLYSGTAAYQLKLGKHFSGTVTYTLKSYSPFNIGGGLVLQFLNMQYFFVTDNWYAAVAPLDSKNANLTFGMNMVVGNRIRKKGTPEAVDFQPVKDAPVEEKK